KLTVDERGLLLGLEQSGWRLAYREYTRIDGYHLPSHIALSNGDTNIEIVIDRWFGLPGAPDGPEKR
ncbi:MAG: hypothetical protein L0H83_09295, partial [Salinisphaera sp.]|nr:hypothetical protein [Salinisphaera sp.]